MVNTQLNKKLLRDLWHMKAQVLSISVVVAIGVAVYFGFTSTHRSLLKSRDNFYSKANYSDLFVKVKKAPEHAAQLLSEIEGVASVETRLEYEAPLSIPGVVKPAVGHFVSIPDGRQPSMNQLYLIKGRLPSALSPEEVVLSEGFFKSHQFDLGDYFFATLNGRKRKLVITGVGVTPEYIIAIQGGSPFPDDEHFGVIWLNQSLVAATYDMRASFNSAVIKTTGLSLPKTLIRKIDQTLDKYGNTGAHDRDKQISHVYVREELKQLKVQATTIPVIFFLVAVFILNIVISRLIRTHRDQIATLKAVGYFNRDISGYYFKVAGLIVLLGSFLGILMGIWIGSSMVPLYGEFYHFPELSYEFTLLEVGLAVLFALFAASLGTYSSLKRIFLLQPAEAMRPPAPPSFHRGVLERQSWFRMLKTRGRMMVRGVTAFPKRSLMTGVGMSFSIVLLLSGLFWMDSIDYLMLAQYSFGQKETGSIQLTHPVSPSAVYEVNRYQGVLEAEGYRNVPVKVTYKNREESTLIKGLPYPYRLTGIINEDLDEIQLTKGGVYISRILANQLSAEEGSWLDIEVLEGKKPKFQIQVEKIVDSFMSNEIITSRQTVAEMLSSRDLVDRILFRSMANPEVLYTKLKEMPNVLAVAYRDSVLKMFTETSANYILVFAFILSLFAGAIGFGIAYNNMRVVFAERDWELATLRILGFTVPEVFRILISEIVLLLIFFTPFGWVCGYLAAKWLMGQMVMDAFQIPFVIDALTFFFATMVMLISTALSTALIYRMVKKADLVATLKARS